MVKVTIDQDACIACGMCYNICPEVYEDDGSGTAQLVEEYRETVDEGYVSDNIDCTQDGADSCPVDAIQLE
ncbi:MAG: ferredoxin [Thermoplasmatota archaeon]